MSNCDDLLREIEAAVAGELSADLADHLASCSSCQLALDRSRGLADGARVLHGVRAPEDLKARLKTIAQLAPACDHAQQLAGAALDSELDPDGRAALLTHLHGCSNCQAVWDAFATLREVGTLTKPSARALAALSIHPTRRIEVRRRKRFLDLRLATAAAYLLAAASVVLISNPATVARASNDSVERASVYARAAVENRVTTYSRRAFAAVASAHGWVRENASEMWSSLRRAVGGRSENPPASKDVVKGGDGGRR
jgi:hypothetical protein